MRMLKFERQMYTDTSHPALAGHGTGVMDWNLSYKHEMHGVWSSRVFGYGHGYRIEIDDEDSM
jgi:hypothetical protein